jgi:Fur family ferric uptake transcriptional regulator
LVLQALGAGDHVSADEVFAHARARYPAINPSTVYRTLDALVTVGIARRTDLGTERLYYEVARPHRHHHAVCQRCGAVAHLHDGSLRPLAEALRAETGFELTPDREIAIPGLCPACRGDAAPRVRKDTTCTSRMGSSARRSR